MAEKMICNKEFAPQEGLIKELQMPIREEICLNGFWNFMAVTQKSSKVSIKDMPNSVPKEFIFENTKIKVPSPWNVNGFLDDTGGDFNAYPSYPKEWESVKSGWLVKTVKIPKSFNGNIINLHFEAIAGFSRVFINGYKVKDNFELFLPFNVDITKHINNKEEITIAVFVCDASLFDCEKNKFGYKEYVAGSFWGQKIVGIWQDVYLQKFSNVYVKDIFVKPNITNQSVTFNVTIYNKDNLDTTITLNGSINEILKKENLIEQYKTELGKRVINIKDKKFNLKKQSVTKVKFTIEVKNNLKLWDTNNPNLYGVVLNLFESNKKIDIGFEKFGYREFKISGKNLYLNKEKIQIKGDSWHFMGVPQMTRRYAYGWYKMLKEANGNGVRLHAQPFPRFYLDIADEMGICILDETAIWFSNSNVKIDSDIYWERCNEHVKKLILRDRNHPSIFGWSVCNETLEVTSHVMHAPINLIMKNVKYINHWVDICRHLDSTRTWISGDGELLPDTKLPTRIIHYVNEKPILKLFSLLQKPWGIGETGMAYFGTPKQVSKINGDNAYISQQHRMEGLAGEAFTNITNQRNNNAAYTSTFNIVWYGLKPLPLGLKNVKNKPTLNDGIHFSNYVDGKVGYQPERLGPYCTTLNVGYDETLPMYEPWPMFHSVKLAFSDNYKNERNIWNKKVDNTVGLLKEENKNNIVILSSIDDEAFERKFENIGVRSEAFNIESKDLIIINGESPIEIDGDDIEKLKTSVENGSNIFIWNFTEKSKTIVEKITNETINLYSREASSYTLKKPHTMFNGESNSSYYFCEDYDGYISKYTIGGSIIKNSDVLLEACNTDWRKWNYQPETIKTAKVYRNELEKKPRGEVVIKRDVGKGQLIISTLDLFKLEEDSKEMVRNIVENLGGVIKEPIVFKEKAISKTGIVKNVLLKNNNKVLSSNKYGFINFSNDNKLNNLSFSVYSPRSLTDLLIEPGIPILNCNIICNENIKLFINKKEVMKTKSINGKYNFKGIPFEKGWNEVTILIENNKTNTKLGMCFTCSNLLFLNKLKSLAK